MVSKDLHITSIPITSITMKSILTISRGHARELLEYPYLLRRSRQSVQKDSIPLIVLNFEIILTDIHLKGRGEPMDSRILLLHLGRLMRLLTILIILFRQGNKNSGVRAASDLVKAAGNPSRPLIKPFTQHSQAAMSK